MRSSELKKKLFTKHGMIKGLRNVVEHYSSPPCDKYYNIKSLEDLEKAVDTREVSLYDILSLRGNGDKRNPGLLAQYLFDLPSAQESKRIRVLDNLGDGI